MRASHNGRFIMQTTGELDPLGERGYFQVAADLQEHAVHSSARHHVTWGICQHASHFHLHFSRESGWALSHLGGAAQVLGGE